MMQAGRMRLVLWLVIVVVFGLGAVTGAALDGLYRSRASAREARPAHSPDQMLEKMRGDLNLNDQQSQQIRAILDDTRTQYRSLRTEVRPRYDSIRQQARTRIRAVLSPEQQKRFDAIVAERDAKREEEGKERR